jgi:DNA mismatch endonuclease (patch repair protein)
MMTSDPKSKKIFWARQTLRKTRSKNTSPEIRVQNDLDAAGIKFSTHLKILGTSPDIVMESRKTAIFIHGCFWHGHEGCRNFKIPETNPDFWFKKINTNKTRDLRNEQALKSAGWTVLVFWECEV